MRYRVKDYRVEVNENIVWLYFQATDEIILTSKSDNEIEDYILQAIRLVVDESAGIVLCSSMQKHKYIQHAKANANTREVQLAFNIPSGKTVGNDLFTIEMDWGDTINDNIPTDYAKETTVRYNTSQISNIQDYLQNTIAKETTAQQAASDASVAKTAAQALLPIAQAAEAYNTGKVELAANLTSKGVTASANETIPELAEKVSAIVQETYEINGGEMYAKQLFGSLETPNYWNLYEVLEQLLSDGRLVSYGGILLAEYYRGYDSIALEGAGAGGVYVVSDMEDGQFKMYTEDTTHIWATEFDGKGNRWVAYCFADEYHDFQITDTNTSPRSIFIGRKVGTINCLVNTRISEIVVTDGNQLNDFNGRNFSHYWSSKISLRNLNSLGNSGNLFYNVSKDSLYVQGNVLPYGKLVVERCNFDSVIVNFNEIYGCVNYTAGTRIKNFIVKADIINAYNDNYSLFGGPGGKSYVDTIVFDGIKSANIGIKWTIINNRILLINPDNDKLHSISITAIGPYYERPNDIEIENGWCKPIHINNFNYLTEANMYAHILQRLKQDEPDCGDGVTITLGSTNLAKLTSAESVQLLDDLTNIYGYTFA